ncbi:outer membrane beta-barrel protein [Devosia rhizoryzae]|uniref:Outer membrane beta-barrel protein n=1 Tax=Devosia rhizoryzae TaxID=2774137 RepID=A0ABX7C723_9HYPH|nr:outer membrane beta-barrel protein [Devosia rhizoryzae]QQR39059.1 outer membrane beta-barrel protein [Devosia rhizoryzae]
MTRRHLTLLTLAAATALTGTALADPPKPISEERLRPGLYPAAPVPEEFAVAPPEPGHPPFDLDWSVGLKGTYTSANTGNSFVSTLNPRFTATHDGLRANVVIDGAAEIAKPWQPQGEIDVPALRLGITATAPIDSTTTAFANASLALNQQLPTTPGLDPLIIQPPEVFTGTAGVGVDRAFGKFTLAARGTAERNTYGPTTRRDTGVTDNTASNVWELDSSLRLGFQATPIIEVFAEASTGRDYFDQPSALGVRSDATDMALRGGVAGEWNSVLSASASAGYGYHNFDDASLVDVATQLYDASITYRPDPTISLTARYSTSIEPVGADARGTARISQTAVADVSYIANSWLRLRASADWGRSVLTGSTETEQRYGAGAGADYKINSHTAVSADYNYLNRDNSVTGVVNSHTVSLGVTLKR